jgi:hypothetical protein
MLCITSFPCPQFPLSSIATGLSARLSPGLMGNQSLESDPPVRDISTNNGRLYNYILDTVRLNLKEVLGKDGGDHIGLVDR